MNATCQDIRPLLSGYMDSDLDPAEVRAVQAHVVECAECAAVLADYRELRTLVRTLPQPVPPVALREAVFAKATPAYRQRALLWDFGQRGLAYGAVLVACVALLFTGTLLVRSSTGGAIFGGADKVAPLIIWLDPTPGTENWSLTQPIRISFSEPMDEDSVLTALRLTADPPIDEATQTRFIESAYWEGTTLVIGSGEFFRPDTDYTLSFAPDSARDRAGNLLQASQLTAYRFRTINAVTAVLPATATVLTAPVVTPTRTLTIAIEVTPPPLAPTEGRPATTPVASPTIPAASVAPVSTPTAEVVTVPVAPTATATALPPTATPEPVAPPVVATATAVPPTAPPAPTATATTPPPTATATPAAPTTTPTPKLPYSILGGAGEIYERNSDVRERLGLPTGNQAQVGGAYQLFQNGLMFWRADTHTIYVLFNDQSVWYAFADSWVEGMDVGGGAGPAAGQYIPKRGFGKVWREQVDVQKRLGYALTTDELPGDLVVQPFERGAIMQSNATGSKLIYVLYQNNLYERYADPVK